MGFGGPPACSARGPSVTAIDPFPAVPCRPRTPQPELFSKNYSEQEFPGQDPSTECHFLPAFPQDPKRQQKHSKTIIVECQFWPAQDLGSYFQKHGHPRFWILSPQQSLSPGQVTKNKHINILLCVDSGMLVISHRRAAPRQRKISSATR
jgi:hypothetical protein